MRCFSCVLPYQTHIETIIKLTRNDTFDPVSGVATPAQERLATKMKIPKNVRWKAVETIGKGGQATVVKVEDTLGEHGGYFALKGIAPGRTGKAYERFAREVEAIQRLDHPNIVRIVDHSIEDKAFNYYVMEFIEGARPLKRILGSPDNPFANDTIASLRLFSELVSAIEEWSKAGIVHRDLSPGNILLLPNNSIKVIDFGICQIEDRVTITLADEGVGTINYMAPECESGASGEVTEKADLYSAGKILWSCICNAMAFSRESPVFNAKSMFSMLPRFPDTWHLHHLFEVTIRHSPKDRSTVDEIQTLIGKVAYLIKSGVPPLEIIAEMCPICGIGKLEQGEGLHNVFGNPNPVGIHSYQCSMCGTCFAINRRLQSDNLKRRKTLS
jgi:serine/threonine protein kinase